MKTIKKEYAGFLKFGNAKHRIEALEEKYEFYLPPIFKAFVTNFSAIHGDVIMTSSSQIHTLTYYSYSIEGRDVLFEDFMEIENVFKYRNNSENWIENGVVPITLHSHGGTILLGVKQENSDKLFYEHDEGQILIEDNIFSFLRNLNFVCTENIDFEGIYKKWNENFWRSTIDKKN